MNTSTLEKAVDPNQPVNPKKMIISPGFGGEHLNFFVRLTGRLSRCQPDPHQSTKFMFMCLFLKTNCACDLHVEDLRLWGIDVVKCPSRMTYIELVELIARIREKV